MLKITLRIFNIMSALFLIATFSFPTYNCWAQCFCEGSCTCLAKNGFVKIYTNGSVVSSTCDEKDFCDWACMSNGYLGYSENVDCSPIFSYPCMMELIYGEDSKETELLRYFRDNVLNQTPEGQEIIRLYYQWSPVIVKSMEEDEELKEEVKEMIDGILLLTMEEEE